MTTEGYPRLLRAKEADLLQFVLPADRPGYRELSDLLEKLVVLGEGRRGPGNVVLGFPGDEPDVISPLPPVIAYGVVETTQDHYFITVREQTGRQVDIEIVSRRGEEVPDHFEEKRRWTYSSWQPGMVSPCSRCAVREVVIGEEAVLALAPGEGRIWVWGRADGMVRPVPMTSFSHALMKVRGVRDPKVAVRPALLFEELGGCDDRDLRRAFIAYNAVHPKVGIAPPVGGTEQPRPWIAWIKRLLGRTD